MMFLQSCFTTLWSLWNHINLVLHQGKTPNPMEVLLTSQSLLCKYQDAFKNNHSQVSKPIQHSYQRPQNQRWQIIIKVAAHKNRRSWRSGYAYEAKSMEGRVLFTGGVRKGRKTPYLVLQDAMGEAIFKAKELGFNKVIILSNSKRLGQICNGSKKPTWQEHTLVTDLNQLQQQGLSTLFFCFPRLVLSRVVDLAYITTCFPVHLCTLNPTAL